LSAPKICPPKYTLFFELKNINKNMKIKIKYTKMGCAPFYIILPLARAQACSKIKKGTYLAFCDLEGNK